MLRFNVERFSLMIELWLKVNGISIHDLSDATHIGVSTLYTLKSGQQAPTMAQFTAICGITDFAPETFFKKEKTSK